MKRDWLTVAAGFGLICLAGLQPVAAGEKAEAEPAKPAPATIDVLDLGKGVWRVQLVRATAEYLTASGKVEKVGYSPSYWQIFDKKPAMEPGEYKVTKLPEYRLPESTPADWNKPEFDDSQWARISGGPSVVHDEGWKLILARNGFEVTDPAQCEGLTLSASYRGGIVVYLNGEEVARQDMMAGQSGLDALAEPYPESAYLTARGKVLSPKEFAEKPNFNRKLSGCAIPAAKLRKGWNVLAVEVHRAPLDKACLLRGNPEHNFSNGWMGKPVGWSAIGLQGLKLTAPSGAAAAPAAMKLTGLKLWTQPSMQGLASRDPAVAYTQAWPVRMAAPRGGAGVGVVLAGAPDTIKGLTAQASDLKGPGTIPASAVQIRYPAGDALNEGAPAQVSGGKDSKLAVQGLWLTVSVPETVAPGEYSGTLTVSAEGWTAQTIQLKLSVAGWILPAPDARVTHTDFIESPESLAMRYGVEMWSDEHMKLLDRTFELLAPLSLKTLYVTAVRRTHLGNEQAMVRWVRGANGRLEPDLSIVEKYVDVASKRLGKIPSVILYAWEPPDSQGHAGNPEGLSRTHDREILLTLKNAKTGEIRAINGPDWGTPESKDLWGKLIPAVEKLLKDRGMEGSLLVGMIGDHRPTKLAMQEMTIASPSVKFAVHSHMYASQHFGYKVGMCSSVWGIGCNVTLPEYSPAGHGWRSDFRLTVNSRYGLGQNSSPNMYLTMGEIYMFAHADTRTAEIPQNDGVKGIGRIGADFWPVIKDSAGNFRGQLCGQYPETAWGQLSIRSCTQWMLAPGPKGPLSTIRAEALREGNQGMEAHAFIDRALVEKALRAKLGDELVQRCTRELDLRRRLVFFSGGWEGWVFAAGVNWPEQNSRLYRLAAEVADKTGQTK